VSRFGELDFRQILSYTSFLKPGHLFRTAKHGGAWERRAVVDIWWVVLAFVCGGYTGMLLLAILAISRQDARRPDVVTSALAAAAAVPGSIDAKDDAVPG
jgi:hypothetical protein